MIETFNHLPRFWHSIPSLSWLRNHHCSHGCPYSSPDVCVPWHPHLQWPCSLSPATPPMHFCLARFWWGARSPWTPLITPKHSLILLSFPLHSPVFFQSCFNSSTLRFLPAQGNTWENRYIFLLKYFLPPSWILAISLASAYSSTKF